MHRATHYLAVLGEDDLYVGLLNDGCVEVPDENSGVEGTWIILIGHVAGLGFTSHSPPVALLGHRVKKERKGRTLVAGQVSSGLFCS